MKVSPDITSGETWVEPPDFRQLANRDPRLLTTVFFYSNVIDMSMRNPDSGQGKVRESFKDASENEKIERYKRLHAVFNRGSTFRNFWDNVEKYSDRFESHPSDKTPSKKNLRLARQQVELAATVISAYREVHLEELGGTTDKAALEQIQRDSIDSQLGFVKGRQIDTERVVKALEWAFNTFIKFGPVINRDPDITPEQATALLADLQEMLNTVNKSLK